MADLSLMDQYVDDVLAGRVVACRWVVLGCERHRRDLAEGGERGIWWDEEAAEHVVDFFEVFLRHSKGEWAGEALVLEPWQVFFVGSLFGWKRADGTRRFRTGYLEVGRKNGKSTMMSGIGLYLVSADGEPGAEVYTGATKREQARIIHQESVRMVKQSPWLSKYLTVVKDNIHSEATFSKYEPLGRDSKTADGLNVHGGLIDELHAHPTGELWDVLETGTGSRRQPLMVAVTTAGHDRQSVCFQFSDYTEKVLSRVLEDGSWLGMIYTLDRDEDGDDAGRLEDWEDEESWIKANPNLGVSKKVEDLRDKARKVKGMPARLNAFLQKELNVWTQASTRWVPVELWRKCNVRPVVAEELVGMRCYGGLDLSSTIDITALVLVFEAVGRGGADHDLPVRDVLCWFWIPEENVLKRVREDRVPYDVWIRQGFMETTPGNVVDYDFILATIQQAASDYQIEELAFDPWNATSVTNTLGNDGATLLEFRQGFVSMNPAMKALEVAIRQGTINHGGNPVLTWMADNLVARMDPAGNLKPDKEQSREKIDGMVSLIMALGRATLHGEEGGSVYEERGVLSL